MPSRVGSAPRPGGCGHNGGRLTGGGPQEDLRRLAGQSDGDGLEAWGEVGMDAMWSAATKKIIGVDIDDWNFAQGVSTLIGARYVGRGSYSKSKDGYSHRVSEQREQVLEPGDIRSMRKGTALLMSTGMPVAQIALRPWYGEKAMAHIGPQMKQEEAAITKRAVAAYEERPSNGPFAGCTKGEHQVDHRMPGTVPSAWQWPER
ncbi:TraM recognition domain-containing protein [Streptomyces sp. NPDC029216]|uniref:TraM recognition domain-containing protein n=1 Tax=Streptomyces sp. NPDC029216 TaxID=3154701 RepID=UPI003400917D